MHIKLFQVVTQCPTECVCFRGGGEFGRYWHKQATGHGKRRTFEVYTTKYIHSFKFFLVLYPMPTVSALLVQSLLAQGHFLC